MKKLIVIIIFFVFSNNGYSQGSPVDKIFEKYANKDGITTVYISKYMFALIAGEKSKSKDEFDKAIKGLESIRILSVDDPVLNKKINFYNEIIKNLPANQYKELMTVKEKGQDIKMLLKEKNGKIVEFLMIGGGKDNMLICITGNIDIGSIAKLSKAVNEMKNKPKKK